MIFGLSGEEAVAWVAAITAAVALGNQAVSAVRKRKKEHDEVEEALEHAPQVRHQLEIGNVGAAVGHLNVIMESQAQYIHDQDERIGNLVAEIGRLKDRALAAEAETDGWTKRYQAEVEARLQARQESEARIRELEAEIEQIRRDTARTLAQMRQQLDGSEYGEES